MLGLAKPWIVHIQFFGGYLMELLSLWIVTATVTDHDWTFACTKEDGLLYPRTHSLGRTNVLVITFA